MKMRVKPIVVDVEEDDGMWLDKSTYTYYSKDQLESIEEPKGLDETSNKYGRDWYRKRMNLSHRCRGCYSHIVDAFKAGYMKGAADKEEKIINKAAECIKKNVTFMHPRKEREVCMVNIGRFKDAMKEE